MIAGKNPGGHQVTLGLVGVPDRSDWSAAKHKPCRCNACVRGDKGLKLSEAKRQHDLDNGKSALFCEPCGGTRLAGGGAFTSCSKRGMITVCLACYKPIMPVWKISPGDRARLADSGYSPMDIVKMNHELTEMWAVLDDVTMDRACEGRT